MRLYTIQVKVTAEEKARIKQFAAEKSLSSSSFLRNLAISPWEITIPQRYGSLIGRKKRPFIENKWPFRDMNMGEVYRVNDKKLWREAVRAAHSVTSGDKWSDRNKENLRKFKCQWNKKSNFGIIQRIRGNKSFMPDSNIHDSNVFSGLSGVGLTIKNKKRDTSKVPIDQRGIQRFNGPMLTKVCPSCELTFMTIKENELICGECVYMQSLAKK